MKILINNPNLQGKIYIEDFNDREEDDRIKIYDSDLKYIDYLPLNFGQDNQINYNIYIESILRKTTIADLLNYLACDFEFIGTKEDTIKYLHDELNWDLPCQNYNPFDNEYIIRIGKTYVVLCDN